MAFGPDTNSILQRIDSRLENIYRLIELQNRSQIETIVRKLATTKERRKMWILCDGLRKTEEIARLSGNALRTVQQFVQEGERAGLLDTNQRGYPRRRFDVIPSDWSIEVGELEKALQSTPAP